MFLAVLVPVYLLSPGSPPFSHPHCIAQNLCRGSDEGEKSKRDSFTLPGPGTHLLNGGAALLRRRNQAKQQLCPTDKDL
jgi:hypothetical protein